MKYILSLLLLLLGNTMYAQLPPNCSSVTPNGSLIELTCHSTEPLSPAEIAAYRQNVAQQFPNAYIMGDASGMYNCHSYAWWWTSSSNHAWMETPNDDVYWNDGSYSQTGTWSQSTRISYVNGDHSGRNYPGYTGWIYSKWGPGPIMIHWYTDSPYDDSSIKLYN